MNRIFIFLVLLSPIFSQAQIFSGDGGKLSLKGVAPQETITAETSTLKGRLDPASKKFNFRQSLSSFSFSQGEMQKKDAEEMYWETEKYPHASYQGQIINDVDLTKAGTYQVTTQGTFSMHGIEKTIKVPAVVKVSGSNLTISAKFEVYLSDYDIKIPRLVVLKVSEKFEADISMNMKR